MGDSTPTPRTQFRRAKLSPPPLVRVVPATRLLSVKPFVGSFNYGGVAQHGRRLGRLGTDACTPGSDRYLDLVFGFHGRDLLRAAESALGQPLYDGDLVALTLTGRLKREADGLPVVGESIVVVKGHRRPVPHGK